MGGKRPRDGLLSRLLARPFAAVKQRLSGGGNSPAGGKAAAAAASLSEPMVDEAFTLALKDLLQEDEGQFQTKLQIVSLVEFREAVGAKWAKLAEKVMLIAEGVIHRHIGQGNIFGRQGQDFFVLLFRNVPPAEGRRRAVTIAQELGTRLVGDQFTGFELPLALAAEVALEEGVNPDGSLNYPVIHAAIGEMRSLMAEEAEDRQGRTLHAVAARHDDGPILHSQLPGPLPVEDLRRHLQPSAPVAKEPAGVRRSMLPSAPPPPKPVVTKPPIAAPAEVKAVKPADDPGWRTLEVERHTATDPTAASGAPPLTGDAVLSVLWRPTWVASGEVIGAYKAQIQRLDRPGQPPLEGSLAYPAGGGPSAITLDRFTIAATVREMRATDAIANRSLIVVPMHWASVGSAQRLSVTAPLADLSEGMRSGRLIIDLFGVPDGIGPRDLADGVNAIRPLCRQVILRQPLSAMRAAIAADCGITMIGLDLAELRQAERTDDDHLLEALAGFREVAERCRLPAYVWGARRRKVVVGAVLGGFAMVNGPGLMKELGRPAKVLPAPRSRFATPAPPPQGTPPA
jgi:hypothetical protein